MNRKTPDKSTPSVAVVICTKERPASLIQTLESVWTQSQAPDELLIVDDGELQKDVTSEIAAKCKNHRIRWGYEKKKSPGLTQSRNLAARLARSDVLLFLDDDVTCASNLVQEIAELMRDWRVAALSPLIDEPVLSTRSARLYQLGYRIAGWWKIHPPQCRTDRPEVLNDPGRAAPLKWLSGAAMAIRRRLVLQNPFDVSLSEYALGEDREMGYRLMPLHWLIEARGTRVIHRREPSGRIDHHRMGYMTSHNYLYILNKTCKLGVVEWAMIAWSLTVLACMHLLWGVKREQHFEELSGMIAGIVAYTRKKTPHPGNTNHDQSLQETAIRNSKSEKPLRALFVTTSLHPGGAELMLLGLLRAVDRSRIEPVVLCLKESGALADSFRDVGVKVYDQFLRHKKDALVLPRIRNLIRDESIDMVVVAHSGGDRMFWSTLAARSLNVPVVVWSHWLPQPGKRHLEPPNRMLLRAVDAYVALGHAHRDALIRHEQIPVGRIHVIPNAIDLDQFDPAMRASARQLLRLGDQQIAVGIVANMRPEKRHDVFIEAARQLHLRNPQLRFFIIGDGPHRDAVLASAAASGLNHDILRLIGARSDIPKIMPGLDICCLCSEVECFSVTMLEAAASHCAFIGPDVGCIPEFIAPMQTGVLIPPADVRSLIASIEMLAVDNTLRQALSDQALRRAHSDYSLYSMAQRFSDLLNKVHIHRIERSKMVPAQTHRPKKSGRKHLQIA